MQGTNVQSSNYTRVMIMTYVDELRARLSAALSKIDDLEDQILDLEMQVDDLEQEKEREDDGPDYGDDEWSEMDEHHEEEWLDMRQFIRDIGFDPTNLPASVGERMAIARILEAARMFK